jgi:hypothetical protein
LIKILDLNYNRLAIIKNVNSSKITTEINGEYKFDFECILDEKTSNYVNENNLVEIEEDYFDIITYTKKQNEDGTHHPEEYKVKEILEKFNHAHFIIPAVDAEKIEELQQKELEKNTSLSSSLVSLERMKRRKEMTPYERLKDTIGDNTRHKGRLI